MNPYIIDLEFIKIKWYSVLILLGILISFFWMVKEAKRFSLKKEFIVNLLFWTIVFGIIGARAYYVLFNLEYYLAHPSEILQIWNGGIAIHGALIFGILTIIVYTKKYKISTLRILDMASPCVLFAQAIGRWGNFFNGEAYGVQTTLAALEKLHLPDFIIEGMYINGHYYTPTFLYESLWCLLGLIVLLIIRRLKYTKVGYQVGFYMIWYSIGRFYIESLRLDSLMFENLRVAQFVSILMFSLGLIIILIQSRKPKLEELYNTSEKIEPKRF